MNPVAQPKHNFSESPWRQRLTSFGLTVIATVVGGLMVAGILWGIGALNQVGNLTAKVDRVQNDMSHRFDKLEASIITLSDDSMLRKIEKNMNKLRYDVDGFVSSQYQWRDDVELRLTNLEDPVGGSADDDRVQSDSPAHYLPELRRGSRH